MAGDWIKMRSDLFTHPKVVRMASALKADGRPDVIRVVGGLMSVWCLFDAHSVDGVLEGYTFDLIDDHLRWGGFADAMKAVGWIAETGDGFSLSLPDFDKHNGQSAKRRAQDADRKREDRKTSADEADKKRTREEKRREEKEQPAPKAAGPGFETFWSVWPKSDRKGSKAKCRDVWAAVGLEQHCAVIVAHVEAMAASESWRKQGGEFIPAPLVYLNQRRWDGAEVGQQEQGTQPEWMRGAI